MSIFLQHPNITGETSDQNHKGCIDVIEATFGVGRQITSSSSTQGDRESSNATISNLRIMKFMDKTSPYMFIESCCGTGKTLKLYMTKTGTGQGADVFAEYTLENALFSRMDMEAVNDSGSRPIEAYEISFTKLTTKYIPYDEDGNATAPTVIGFDTATNKKV